MYAFSYKFIMINSIYNPLSIKNMFMSLIHVTTFILMHTLQNKLIS